MIWVQVGILIAQIIIALVSYFTIHRHRAIYGLRTAVLRMPSGSRDDVDALDTTHIDNLLTSGKFTILSSWLKESIRTLKSSWGKLRSKVIPGKAMMNPKAHVDTQSIDEIHRIQARYGGYRPDYLDAFCQKIGLLNKNPNRSNYCLGYIDGIEHMASY